MAANRQSVQRNPVYPSGDNLWRFKIRSLCRGGGEKAFIEVKGVTLEEDGVCLFPDAPSERAVRHIEELIKAKKKAMRQSSFS